MIPSMSRRLYIIGSENQANVKGLIRDLQRFKPLLIPVESINSDDWAVRADFQSAAMLIATSVLPTGMISGLTKIEDLPFLYLLADDEAFEVARFWYNVGAEFVMSYRCPPEILEAAIEKMLTLEPQSFLSRLTKREMAILEQLKLAGAMGLKRGEITERVWGKTAVNEKNLDVQIFNLRRKLSGSPYKIENRDGYFRIREIDPADVGR